MINLIDQFLSTALVLFVMARAVVLNRRMPWFTRASDVVPDEPDRAGEARKGRTVRRGWRA